MSARHPVLIAAAILVLSTVALRENASVVKPVGPTPALPAKPAAPSRKPDSVFKPSPPRVEATELTALKKEIRDLNACYDGSCDFPKDDPKSYAFAVGLGLKRALLQLSVFAERDQLVSPELTGIAIQALDNPDGHVREAGLVLIATQPPNGPILQSLLDNVIGFDDARLIERGMLELRRYQSPEDLKMIHLAIGNALVTGDPNVSEAISKNVGSFINTESFGRYSSILGHLSTGSVVSRNLRSLLADYRRHLAGA